MATCASCGKTEDGEPEAFCQFCGARRAISVTPSASNKSEDEIVEVRAFPGFHFFPCKRLTARQEYVLDEGKAQRLAPLSAEKDIATRSPLLGPRRTSSRGNVKRISIRLIPCEFEDGGVELVKALEELSGQQEGWVLARYRDDNATLVRAFPCLSAGESDRAATRSSCRAREREWDRFPSVSRCSR